MFDSVAVSVEDSSSCADALVASIAAERRAVAVRFALVAAWADFHCPGWRLPEDTPEPERTRQVARAEAGAADGVPPVGPNAVIELAMLLQTTPGAAEALLRDVLELRHRLRRLWDAVLTGAIDGWKARKIAQLTHHLTAEQAQWVDAQVIEAVTGLPWGRAQAVVEGKVIAADPATHRVRLEDEENRRFVSTRRRSNTAGLRTMIARGHAGDIARLEAIIAHLADRLAANGDPDPADTRRAKALAMLANPALTCLFLAQHHPTRKPATTAVEPDAEPDAEPTVEDPEPASAVELAVAFGRVLQELGGKAIDRLRPRTVLYMHLAAEAVQNLPGTAVARVEDPLAGGPISADQLRSWLSHDRITVRPVIDPTGVEPVDGYEIPHPHREALRLLCPFESSPYGTLPSLQADGDHTIPYVPRNKGGPPGQTAMTNLGPLGRRHHLAKTFGGFAVHQPTLGLYYWRTPTGHWYQVDHRGTRALGRQRPQALGRPALEQRTTNRTLAEEHLRDQLVRHLAA